MSYVIRNRDGRYLKVWFELGGDGITRVDLVAKADASSWITRTEARREVVDRYPGSDFTIEER